jgi:ABC-type nickel/cobalt efflux system permease component RcnA
MILKNPTGIFKLILVFLITVFTVSALYSNPFFNKQNEQKAAPPPVYQTGSNKFIEIQFEYREKTAEVFKKIRAGDSGNLYLLLLTAAFLYGLFHAAGPGHRKTIVFSIFLSRKVPIYEPALAGFLSAAIHAGSSILIILPLYWLQQRIITLSGTEEIYAYMEGLTFLTIAIVSIVFIILKVRSLAIREKAEDISPRKLYTIIVITSLVPCPGATMLLLLSLYSDMIGAGIAGVIAMSFGMGIIISLAGYIAYAGRSGLFFSFQKREKSLRILSAALEILSFTIILLFSLLMSSPFIRSVIL